MDARKLMEIISLAQQLKDTTRHCYTASGRRESVAEHSWRAALMAYFLKDEFPKADINKVILMCLIHDLGEAFTGDIPAFNKTADDEKKEDDLLFQWIRALPFPFSAEMEALYREMNERQSLEARIYKAIDGLEAIIQHNESDLSTWLPLEYDMNLTYADDKVAFSPYLQMLREIIRQDTKEKIQESKFPRNIP